MTVVLRKAYGGAYIVMGSKSLGGDFNFAWPGAEIAVLGAEGAVAITGRRELKAAAEEGRDVDEVKNQLVEEYTRENVNPYLSVASGELDAIITPETTRSSIVSSLRILRSKDRSTPVSAVTATSRCEHPKGIRMTSQHSQRWIAHFSGQATPWRTELAELVSDPALAERLAGVRDAGEALLAPVAPELLSVSGSFDLIADPVGAPASPATSMPGIFLAQYGAYLDIAEAIGSEPDAAFGHSQGVLGAAATDSDPVRLYALARLLGAATARQTLRAGALPVGEATPMLALLGVDPAKLSLPENVTVGIVNTATDVVVVGPPPDLVAWRGEWRPPASSSTCRPPSTARSSSRPSPRSSTGRADAAWATSRA